MFFYFNVNEQVSKFYDHLTLTSGSFRGAIANRSVITRAATNE